MQYPGQYQECIGSILQHVGWGIMNIFGSESNYQNNRKIHFTL